MSWGPSEMGVDRRYVSMNGTWSARPGEELWAGQYRLSSGELRGDQVDQGRCGPVLEQAEQCLHRPPGDVPRLQRDVRDRRLALGRRGVGEQADHRQVPSG